MWWRFPHNPTAYDDDWEDQPAQSWFHKWVLGIGLPLLIAGYGVCALLARQVNVGGRITTILNGIDAVAVGIAAVSLAVFLHCHYFWGNIYDQAWFAVLGKIIAACGFIGGLGVLMVRVGVLGI
jgi:hypothetical protein